MGHKRVLFVIVWAFALLVGCATASAAPAASANTQIELGDDHANSEDYVWDSADVTSILLNGTLITVSGSGAAVDGSTVTITAAGNYSISGSLTDGQIIVNTDDAEIVRLILNGVNISNSISAPIYVAKAEETLIVLQEGSDNVLSDGNSYVFVSAEDDEPNATLFSKSNLTIYGTGALTVTGNYNDGIASKDGLVIASGTITVNAVDDGIRGKDYVVIEAGTITVNADGDGLKSDNEEDAALGYISISSGSINVTAGGDAITAQTNVLISDGQFTLASGGGSATSLAADVSAKGIKAVANIQIDGGTLTLNAADDGLHSNANITINGGTLTIASGDDGAHADAALTINGGDLQIIDSYEGIESAVITLNGGKIHLAASDDGVNVSGGNDGSGLIGGPQDQFAAAGSTNYYLYINGGYLVVDANGDGLDANGAIAMTGGVVVVNGPTEQMNGALDYDAGFSMTGGWLVTAGSAGMATAPDTSSTQASLLISFSSMQAAGTLVHLQGSDGSDVLTFAPSKAFQSITFSSPDLTQGASYDVYLGGSSSGIMVDGVYDGGSYNAGSLYTNIMLSSIVTSVGSTGMGMGRGSGRP